MYVFITAASTGGYKTIKTDYSDCDFCSRKCLSTLPDDRTDRTGESLGCLEVASAHLSSKSLNPGRSLESFISRFRVILCHYVSFIFIHTGPGRELGSWTSLLRTCTPSSASFSVVFVVVFDFFSLLHLSHGASRRAAAWVR